MNNKFLLFGIATVIGIFVMHGCSEDYYFDEDFDSLAERRITRSNAEPDGYGTLIDGTIDVTFTQRFSVDTVYIGYDYMNKPLYRDYEINLDFHQYTNTNGPQNRQATVDLINKSLFCKNIYYLVNGLRRYPGDGFIDDSIIYELDEELTSFSPGPMAGANHGDGTPIPFNYYIHLCVGEKEYKLICGYPAGCTEVKKIN